MTNHATVKTLAGIIAAVAAFGATALPVMAGPATVAEFKIDDPSLAGGNAIAFTNEGIDSVLTNITPGTSLAVDFEYTTATNSYNHMAGVLIPATLTINADVSDVASQTPIGSKFIDVQPLTGVTITILANTSVGGLNNLLSVVIPSTGLTFAIDGSGAANLKGDSGNGDTVTLTSDFLANLDTATRQSYSVELTNVTPTIGINENGYLNSFTGTGTGSFATDANTGGGVPEPASLAVLGLGALGLLARRGKSARA